MWSVALCNELFLSCVMLCKHASTSIRCVYLSQSALMYIFVPLCSVNIPDFVKPTQAIVFPYASCIDSRCGQWLGFVVKCFCILHPIMSGAALLYILHGSRQFVITFHS